MPRRNNSFAVSSLPIFGVCDFAEAGGTSPDGATASEADERTPLTLFSVASAPSTVTRFERARWPFWPLRFNPVLGEDPVEGALSLVTRESFSVKLM